MPMQLSPTLQLEPDEEAMLAGEQGKALAFAMRLLVQLAQAQDARRLIPITRAHIDGCLYHGQVSLDFVLRMAEGGARVTVPTTLNVGALDLIHPELNREDGVTASAMRRQMDAYVALGCQPTWTCAPYQLPSRPGLGEQIAWAESNAIVFANAVLGARTNRYGDFIDLCAALVGRVPEAGLHCTANRRGEVVYRLDRLPSALLDEETFYPVLGHWLGLDTGKQIPVLVGLPSTTSEDRLKAFGAASASSGSVAMFHAIGCTPEAPTLEAALQDRQPTRTVTVTIQDLAQARSELSNVAVGEVVSAVSLGTPHYSLNEFATLVELLRGQTIHPDVAFYVNTSRHVAQVISERGWNELLLAAGVHLVVDTCTYFTRILGPQRGAVMTSSAKCAYYAPSNLGVRVAFGSTLECVRSAVEGKVWRDDRLWS
ncbi:MAG: aconitase X catalytic domain-containing protein [Caldilineaceae bacterium]